MRLLSASWLDHAMRKHQGEAGAPLARARRDAAAVGLGDGARDGQAQARAIDVGMNLRCVSAVGAVKQLLTSLKYDVCAAVLYRNRGSFYRMGNASGGITALGRVALDSRLLSARRNCCITPPKRSSSVTLSSRVCSTAATS